jgi:hypothetical protein
MKPRSLRVRLLLGAAGAIAAALALAWVAMGLLFEAHLERSVEASLMQHGRDLIAGLSENAAGELSVDPEPYDPRFDQPASGLYWQAGAGARAPRRGRAAKWRGRSGRSWCSSRARSGWATPARRSS